MKWNEAQLSAITTRNKNILVSAAAGSGKTAVLTERIKRLIVDEGVGIEEMLIVTFTNAAAAEMKERIYKGISEEMDKEAADILYLQEQLDNIGNANISTFHSFCLDVIRDYYYFSELNPNFKICDDAQQEIFSQETMKQLLKEFFEKKDNEDFLDFLRKYSKPGNEREVESMIKSVYGFIKSLPEPFAWLNDSIELLRQSEDELERETWKSACILRDMVIRYDEIYMGKKLDVNQIDFNDIEHIALKILENPEPQNEYRERFRYIFIDEYQDTNSVQEELVKRICRADNVFMVGDVKQSIYQFRLADPQIFIDKYKAFKDVDSGNGIKIDLNRNFRSKPAVLEAVNTVMKDIMNSSISGIDYDEDSMLYAGIEYDKTEAADYLDKPVELDIIVESDIKNDLKYNHSETEEIKNAELEAIFVCKQIKKELGKEYFDSKENKVKKVTLNDIVVLMRSYRGSAEIYQEVFDREGIPAYIEGDDGYFETVEIGIFANILKVISNIRQDIPLISVLYSVIFAFSVDELSEIRIFSKETLFSEAFIEFCENGENAILREKCRKAFYRIREWKEKSHYIPLRDLMWHIAEDSGFYDFIRALPLGSYRIRNLKVLINKAESYQKNTSQGLVGFVKYLEELELNAAPMSNRKPGGEEDNYVRLMSIHKSKGLEFPVVIVSGMGKAFNHRKPSGDISLDRNLGLGLRFRDGDKGYYIKTQRQDSIDEKVKNKETAEEMRILYVAMTRAKEKLILIGTVKKLDEEKLPGEEKSPMECKSFLEWISCPLRKLENNINYIEPLATVRVCREFLWDEIEKNDKDLKAENIIPDEGQQLDIWSILEDESGNETNDEVESNEKRELPYVFESDEDVEIQKEVYNRMSFEYAHKDATMISSKYTATELNRILGGSKVSEGEYSFRPGESYNEENDEEYSRLEAENISSGKRTSHNNEITPAERGTITHKVLQLLDLNRIGKGEIRQQIVEMEIEGKLTEREARAISVEWIEEFFESDLSKRMVKSESVNREKAFLLWIPHDEDTGSIVQGIIDCYFEENGEIILIDYKTDYIPKVSAEEALQEKLDKYYTQIDIYRNAIEESLGKNVKEAYLYFLRTGREVRVI